MKNIQIVDGAINSTFNIYQLTEEKFKVLFPRIHQDIAFIEDFGDLIDDLDFLGEIYNNRVDKRKVAGIHGTLHLTGSWIEEEFFPN